MDFFIVGTSRSGSTLLRRMLDAHPGVDVLNESHWVPRMWDLFGDAAAPVEQLISVVERTHWDSGRRVVDVNLELVGGDWASLAGALRRRLGREASIAAFHDALVEELFGSRPGVPSRGDKTPDYGFYMGTLQRLWPEARFVHVVRNGIDTALSMSRHSGCQLMISAGYDNWVPLSLGDDYRRHHRLDLPFDRYVASWRRRMQRIRAESRRLHPGSYLEIRYERLTSEPHGVLRDVATHLDLAATDEWLTGCARLIRLRKPAEVTRAMLRDLTRDDIEALQRVDGLREDTQALLRALAS